MSGKVHLWVPGFSSTTGGIQSFSALLIEALHELIDPEDLRVFTKNDIPVTRRQNNGFPHIRAFGNWPSLFRTSRFASECLREALHERPRLIVSTHLHFGPLAHVVHSAIRKPYVLVAHGVEAWHLRHLYRRKALEKADLVLAVSRYTRECLIQHGLDPRRVEILPNTFSPRRFSILPKPARLLSKYDLEFDTPVILTVCRLAEAERYKGYDQIVRALPQILRVLPNARYLLVGAGPDRPRIEKLVSDVGVAHAVILAGFIPDEELAEYYNLCDVFAMPSKAEGFGIVYLEALACGKPVLAGNRDGSCDALADGELGILVDPDDTDQIARELILVLRRQHQHQLIFQPELLRQRVTELFGFDVFRKTVEQRLNRFLN